MGFFLKTQQWSQDWKRSVFIPIPKKGNAKKNAQTTAQLGSSHMLVKSCSKFSKPGFSNIWTVNFQMFKLVLEKAEEPEIKLPPSAGSWKKQESSRKTPISALLTMPKPLTVWITINCGKFFKRWEYQTPWPASWEICRQVKIQQLELDLEPQTVSKLGKEYVKAVYCHSADLTYMQSASWEMQGWKKHNLESRLPGEISITSDTQMTQPCGRKRRRTKELLDEVEKREWKSWLKTKDSEN